MFCHSNVRHRPIRTDPEFKVRMCPGYIIATKYHIVDGRHKRMYQDILLYCLFYS